MTKKKKWLIAGGVIIGIVAIFLILLFTVFTLKTVDIKFHTSVDKLVGMQEQIIEKGDFRYNSTVVFHSKKGYVDKLEKEFPYLEVVNIETVFPNKFVLHVAEREEVYAVKTENDFLICDENFKILNIVSEYNSTKDNAMLLENINVKNKEYTIGSFLQVLDYAPIYSGLIENNRKLNEQTAIIESISFSKVYDSMLKKDLLEASIKTFNGQTYNIQNCTYLLKNKLSVFLQIYSQIYSLIGTEFNVEGEESPKIWTKELLDSATININNYYLEESGNGQNCYFVVIPPKESLLII